MTPLGPLNFFAAMGPDVIGLSALCPAPNSSFSQEAFETSTARGTLWMAAVDPGLLPEQRVDACYGVLWRMQAMESMPDHHGLEFTCTWGSSSTWTTTGWHSGETVQGRSWQHDLIEVNGGTIDAEGGLPWYGDSPEFELPPRWFQETRDGGRCLIQGGVETSLAGLVVKYPSLRQGEVCHAQFVVAWKARRDLDDDDTDFAVDLAPGQIIQALASRLGRSD